MQACLDLVTGRAWRRTVAAPALPSHDTTTGEVALTAPTTGAHEDHMSIGEGDHGGAQIAEPVPHGSAPHPSSRRRILSLLGTALLSGGGSGLASHFITLKSAAKEICLNPLPHPSSPPPPLPAAEYSRFYPNVAVDNRLIPALQESVGYLLKSKTASEILTQAEKARFPEPASLPDAFIPGGATSEAFYHEPTCGIAITSLDTNPAVLGAWSELPLAPYDGSIRAAVETDFSENLCVNSPALGFIDRLGATLDLTDEKRLATIAASALPFPGTSTVYQQQRLQRISKIARELGEPEIRVSESLPRQVQNVTSHSTEPCDIAEEPSEDTISDFEGEIFQNSLAHETFLDQIAQISASKSSLQDDSVASGAGVLADLSALQARGFKLLEKHANEISDVVAFEHEKAEYLRDCEQFIADVRSFATVLPPEPSHAITMPISEAAGLIKAALQAEGPSQKDGKFHFQQIQDLAEYGNDAQRRAANVVTASPEYRSFLTGAGETFTNNDLSRWVHDMHNATLVTGRVAGGAQGNCGNCYAITGITAVSKGPGGEEVFPKIMPSVNLDENGNITPKYTGKVGWVVTLSSDTKPSRLVTPEIIANQTQHSNGDKTLRIAEEAIRQSYAEQGRDMCAGGWPGPVMQSLTGRPYQGFSVDGEPAPSGPEGVDPCALPGLPPETQAQQARRKIDELFSDGKPITAIAFDIGKDLQDGFPDIKWHSLTLAGDDETEDVSSRHDDAEEAPELRFINPWNISDVQKIPLDTFEQNVLDVEFLIPQ